jgi:hypothetical protein
MYIYDLGSHSSLSLLVKWCTVRIAVGCSLSPHVHFILFVYRSDVCDRIQLRTWILRYCVVVGGMMLFSHILLLPFFTCAAFWMELGVMNLHKWLISNETCFSEPWVSNVFMGKVHTRYCGLLVRRSHAQKYRVMGVTSWFMPTGWRPIP